MPEEQPVMRIAFSAMGINVALSLEIER